MWSLAAENMPAKSGGSRVQRPLGVECDEDGEEIRQMGASGSSNSWRASKTNHLRLFEAFRLQLTAKEEPLAPCAWANLTEAHLCNRELYMTWAFWLSRIYKKPSKGKSGD